MADEFYKTIKPVKSQQINEDDAIHHHARYRSGRGQFTHREEDEFNFVLPEERGKFFILDDAETVNDYSKKEK